MTAILRKLVLGRTKVTLGEMYCAVGATTKQEKHSCRGCLATMHRNGEVKHLERGIWGKK